MTSPAPRDRTRPAELIIISGVLSIFVGLVVLAMLALAVQPDYAEKSDLDEQDREQGGPKGH